MKISELLAKAGRNVVTAEEKNAGKVAGKTATEVAEATAKAAKQLKKLKKLGKGLVGARRKKASEAAKKLGELARSKFNMGPSKPKKFRRSMSERRKALLRDANDPSSGLSKESRDYIKEHKGNKVPGGHEVSHEEPLYTGKTVEEKKALDKSDNMKTMEKGTHRERHKKCGDQFHDYPR